MVTGIVKEIVAKQWNGKTFYSLILVNDGEQYGFGTFSPKANPGDKVTFEASKNVKGYWQGDWRTLRAEASPAPSVSQGASVGAVSASASPSSPIVANGSGRKSPEERGFWEKKEIREVQNDHLRSLGAARNTAIEWVKFLIEKGALPLADKAKPADKEDVLNDILNGYTELFMRGEIVKPERPEQVVKPGRPKKNGDAEQAPLAGATEELPWN